MRDTVGIDRRGRGQQTLRPNLAAVQTWQTRAYGIGLVVIGGDLPQGEDIFPPAHGFGVIGGISH